MATTTVNGWADELLSGLTTNAKAYRLANITKRQSEMKQDSNIADDRIARKKAKIDANDSSVTWTFSKKADTVNTDDLVIEATAPADRGGHTKIWGYVEGTSGKVKKLSTDSYDNINNALDDDHRTAFIAKCNQFGYT
tara:strand:+ start:3405 stop:3818 length:414 start_codon:yes stop_codon:yes gene_type:complete